jgi:hypothetical protein
MYMYIEGVLSKSFGTPCSVLRALMARSRQESEMSAACVRFSFQKTRESLVRMGLTARNAGFPLWEEGFGLGLESAFSSRVTFHKKPWKVVHLLGGAGRE